MADSNKMAIELLSLFNQIGYREYVQSLCEHDAVHIRDFPNLPISETHWLDVHRCFINGKFNPNHVMEMFCDYSGLDTDKLHEKVLLLVEQEVPYWTHASTVCLSMKGLDFLTWLSMMKILFCAVDELMLFILCKMHERHVMVFTGSKL